MVEQGGKGLSFFVLIQYRVHFQLPVFLPQLLTIIKVQRGKQYELGFPGFRFFYFPSLTLAAQRRLTIDQSGLVKLARENVDNISNVIGSFSIVSNLTVVHVSRPFRP